VLPTNERVVFVSVWQMAQDTAQVRYAQADGYRIVVVPDDIARSLGSLTDALLAVDLEERGAAGPVNADDEQHQCQCHLPPVSLHPR
jgi:hypothetical protein